MTELRQKNLDTIQAFCRCNGVDRAARTMELFTDNAVHQLNLGVGVPPAVTPIRQWLENSVAQYPERGFYQPVCYQCDDDNRFILRSVLVVRTPEGDDDLRLSSASLAGVYLTFEMEDGKIKLIREANGICELWPRRYLPTYSLTEEEQNHQREVNRATVDYLMTLSGPDRNLKRRPHFADDGVFQLETLKPMSTNEWLGYIADDVPQWGYYDPRVYSCPDDPCTFVVETYVVGKRLDIQHDRTMYQDTILGAMLIQFDLLDGKVKLFREVPNEAALLAKPR